MKAQPQLLWVNTTGGPHVVIPERHVSEWQGCFASAHGWTGKGQAGCRREKQATDYDRACDVTGWLGVIPVGRGQALVLSGDDTQATYYQWAREHFLLRWLYAESETQFLDHFHAVHARLRTEEEVIFHHPGGKLYLMDSTDIPGRWLMQHQEFELPRGRYRVLSSHSEVEKTYIIIHKLQRD